MIISLSGVPGSGKTSVGKILAERLNAPFYSVGGLRGKMAMEKGMTIDEWNKVGEQDPLTDTSVDDYQRALGKKENHFIIEGRLSWFFIPHSFKIFLSCEPFEAARRIFESQNERPDESPYRNVEHARMELDKRIASDVLRYKKYYGVDYQDPTHYNLVLDTTYNAGPNDTAHLILTSLPPL